MEVQNIIDRPKATYIGILNLVARSIILNVFPVQDVVVLLIILLVSALSITFTAELLVVNSSVLVLATCSISISISIRALVTITTVRLLLLLNSVDLQLDVVLKVDGQKGVVIPKALNSRVRGRGGGRRTHLEGYEAVCDEGRVLALLIPNLLEGTRVVLERLGGGVELVLIVSRDKERAEEGSDGDKGCGELREEEG